jgi:hypothetical protein
LGVRGERRRPPVPLPPPPERGGTWIFMAISKTKLVTVPESGQSPGRHELIEMFYQW